MFRLETTPEIISFLNSLHKRGEIKNYLGLYKEAVNELKKRLPIVAKLYEYYITFEVGDDD